MTRIDPELEARADEYLANRRERSASAPPPGQATAADVEFAATEPPKVHIAVEFTGDIDDLTTLGLRPLSVKRHASLPFAIAFGTIPLDAVSALGEVPHVILVEGSRPMWPQLDTSLKEIRADVLHHATPTPFTGAGVVLAVIDVHFDLSHPDFRTSGGATRILEYLDMGPLPAKGRKSGEKHPLGWVYSQDTIQETLDDETKPQDCLRVPWEEDKKEREKDTRAHANEVFVLEHGTHVAGIAAGNGSASAGCFGPGTYIGVAPDADLLLVRYHHGDRTAVGDNPHLVSALDWIWEHPKLRGRPVVVNISLGQSYGPRDGTTPLELAMDVDLLTVKGGRAIVVAAGNEGDRRRHATGTVPGFGEGGKLKLDLEMGPGIDGNQRLELWYPSADSLRVELTVGLRSWALPGSTASSGMVEPNGTKAWPFGGGVGVAVIKSHFDTSSVRGNSIEVLLMPRRISPDDPKDDRRHPLPAGPWALELGNIGPTKIEFDCWIDTASAKPESDLVFTSHVSRNRTLTVPSTGRHTITVGAYQEKVIGGGPHGQDRPSGLAELSGCGPTRGDRPARQYKPDLVAPGVGIRSARAQHIASSPCCDCCSGDFYKDGDGTSMAAPHVAGVVALMMQINRDLSASEIREYLRRSARWPEEILGPPPNDKWNAEWGGGILDAAAAVALVQTASPPPGGPSAPTVPSSEARGGARGTPGSAPDPAGGAATQGRAGDGTAAGNAEGGAGVTSGETGPRALTGALTHLHRLARRTAAGQLAAVLVSKHFSEVRGLIYHSARVAVFWHRMQGPLLVRALVQAAMQAVADSRPARPPAEIDFDAVAARIPAFLAALERYGSLGLRADVARYGPVLLAAADAETLAPLLGRVSGWLRAAA